jgi:hypothetical protein
MLKIRIYILCHDEYTQLEAINAFGHYEWATIINITTTHYLENIMYASVLQKHRNSWKDYDYVGTLAWRAPQKIGTLDMDAVIANIIRVRDSGHSCDVVSFANFIDKPLISHAQASHPHFTSLWVELLDKLGFSNVEETCNSSIPAFYCNYWMARPQWMDAYISFFMRAKTILDTYEPIQERLWSNSTYVSKMSNEKCMQVFRRPWYPYHTFICERLPCFFFWKHGADIYGSHASYAE